jgi:hypothetical protein
MTRKPKRSVADAGVLPPPLDDPPLMLAVVVDTGVAFVEVGLGVKSVEVSPEEASGGNGGGDMTAWERIAATERDKNTTVSAAP